MAGIGTCAESQVRKMLDLLSHLWHSIVANIEIDTHFKRKEKLK